MYIPTITKKEEKEKCKKKKSYFKFVLWNAWKGKGAIIRQKGEVIRKEREFNICTCMA